MSRLSIKILLAAIATATAAAQSSAAPENSEQRIGAWEVRISPDGSASATAPSTGSAEGGRIYYMCIAKLDGCKWLIVAPAAKCVEGAQTQVYLRGVSSPRLVSATCAFVQRAPILTLDESPGRTQSASVQDLITATIPSFLGGVVTYSFSDEGGAEAVKRAREHFLSKTAKTPQ